MSDEEEYKRLQKKLYPPMEQKIDKTSAVSLYVLSFFIPVIGFIIGALFVLANKDEVHGPSQFQVVGRNCLILSICNLWFVWLYAEYWRLWIGLGL